MRYKLVVFDVDGTITRHVSSWRYIHERLDLWDALAHKYQKKFLKGEISYAEFCRLDAMHWKGLKVKRLERIFKEIPLSKNARPCIKRLKDAGFKLAAVSTGIQFITERVKKELGLDYCIGNRLNAKNGVLTGTAKVNISYGQKGKALKRILKIFNASPRQAICVGDSDGDIPMMRLCGYSIAFNSKSRRLNGMADYVCRTSDFRDVCARILKISKTG